MVENDNRIFKGHCIDHRVCEVKIGQLCTWQNHHDEQHEKETASMREYKERVRTALESNKNLLIGSLVALALNLIGVVSTLGFLIINSAKAGG